MSIFMRKVRVALTLRNHFLKTTLSNGAVVYGKNRPGYGGRGVYIFRDSVEPEFQHLESFLEPAAVFVDIGASTGIYTMKAAQYLSQHDGIVLAVEPFPDVLTALFRNVRANGFTNVRLRNFCAGERTEPGNLWLNFNRPNLFGLVKKDERASFLSTLIVALDDLFEWERLERLDYLKIDVEGAENQVLTGAYKTISQHRPIIQLEVDFQDVSIDLPNYLSFQAPGSHNKIYIPSERPQCQLPEQLGWSRIVTPSTETNRGSA